MNPTAIYSKSGKGVQEASGKTSNLSRADRAVLSAFDGRLTVKDVAERVGKPFDAKFEQLITQLDRDGYIREVSSGTPSVQGKPAAAKPAAAPAKPAASGAGGGGGGADLDFTISIPAAPAPKAPPKAATMTAAAAAKAESDKKVAEDAMTRARREAEERQQRERDKVKAEAEAMIKAETEAKMRSEAAQKAKEAEAKAKKEAEEKIKAEAEAKVKAAREAAVKAAFEAERKVKEEAERIRKEAEEKARREAAELQRKLDEERRAREEAERARQEAERKAKEEAERARKEAEEKARREAAELQRKLDEERRAREEAERRAKEEAERARQEAERARKAAEAKAREDAERRAREQAERSLREEEERRSAAADAAAEAERAARELIEAQAAQALQQASDTEKPAAKGDAGGGSFDSLLADLDSFSDREDEDKKAKEEAERKAKEEKARRQREEAEAKAREEAERRKRDAEELERKLEEEKAKEEAKRKAREEEEAREAEERKAEERKRKRREEAAAKEATAEKGDDIGVSDDDLGMDDVKADQEAVSKESRKAQRAREKEAKEREREARERAREREREEKRASAAPAAAPAGGYKPIRRARRSWGKPIALTLLVLLVGGIGYLHVMPINTQDYEKAASDAIGRPVKIGVARLSVYKGLVLNLENISVGDARIGNARAFPEVGALFDEKKTFSRIELDGATLPQQAIGAFLDVKLRTDKFYVGRVLVNKLKLEGPLLLPTFEAEASVGPQGSISKVELRGPDNLMAKLTPAGNDVDFEATASGFTLPFLPDVTLSTFAMKGRATRDSARIDSWGGATMGGAVNGSANVRWGSSWSLDGQMTLRGINAAVFAPALLSEGNAEGTAHFSMSESDPSKFKDRGRVEGNFSMNRGVLGSFDLSRAILTGGRQATGRTPFIELNGQGAYDRGMVTLRDVTFSAGAMNATANADISPEGALSGRIVADIKTSAQQLRATINVGGTVKEPQVK